MGEDFASIRLGDPLIDLRQQEQTLHGVLDRRHRAAVRLGRLQIHARVAQDLQRRGAGAGLQHVVDVPLRRAVAVPRDLVGQRLPGIGVEVRCLGVAHVVVPAPPVVVVLGEKWLDIVLPLQLIAFVTPFRMIFNTTTPALLGIGRADTFFTNLLMVNIAMPVAVLIGTGWGVNGASFAWLVAYPPLFVLVQYRSLLRLDVTPRRLAGACTRAGAIALAMMLAVLAMHHSLLVGRVADVVSLVILVLLGAAIYTLASLKLNRDQFMETKALIYR